MAWPAVASRQASLPDARMSGQPGGSGGPGGSGQPGGPPVFRRKRSREERAGVAGVCKNLRLCDEKITIGSMKGEAGEQVRLAEERASPGGRTGSPVIQRRRREVRVGEVGVKVEVGATLDLVCKRLRLDGGDRPTGASTRGPQPEARVKAEEGGPQARVKAEEGWPEAGVSILLLYSAEHHISQYPIPLRIGLLSVPCFAPKIAKAGQQGR